MWTRLDKCTNTKNEIRAHLLKLSSSNRTECNAICEMEVSAKRKAENFLDNGMKKKRNYNLLNLLHPSKLKTRIRGHFWEIEITAGSL